jgi:hypothetical protein
VFPVIIDTAVLKLFCRWHPEETGRDDFKFIMFLMLGLD